MGADLTIEVPRDPTEQDLTDLAEILVDAVTSGGSVRPPNQPHRAEIAKLLVHGRHRRKGIAAKLLAVAEAEARARNRSLLTLDTETDRPAEVLYDKQGWTRVGTTPRCRQAVWRVCLSFSSG